MNVSINARFLTQPVTGVQRYAVEVVRELDDMAGSGGLQGLSFALLSPREVRYEPELKNIRLKKTGFLRGHLWEQIELPFYARGSVLLNLCNTAPSFKRAQAVTIHDASVYATPGAYSAAFRTLYKTLWKRLARSSSVIITDSVFSRGELQRFCGMDESRLRVVLLGREHLLRIKSDPSVLERNGIGGRPYVLAVSSLNPNKNFGSVVAALGLMEERGFDFVIAGGMNSKVFGASRPLPGWVKHVGYVDDGGLKALYEHAACFVYPSLYEGFGLPPLEAMSCGCPVVVSSAASIPEVCGDAALYCDPESPEDIAAKIGMVMGDRGLREGLRERGLERAALFTWRRCATEIVQALKGIRPS